VPKEDAWLRWAAKRMTRSAARDAASPVFGEPYADACSLTARERRLVETLPGRGTGSEALRAALGAMLDRHLANGRSPRFLNQLFSGVGDEAMAGALLGVFANNTMSTREVAPLPTEMERAVVSWLLRLVRWDASVAGGTATPGGSFSNYLGVHLARKAAVERHGESVLPLLAFFTSRAGHYSVPKGADLAGVPLRGLFEVETDEEDRMRPDALVDAVRTARARGLLPFLVNATLGTTVAGSLDPVLKIAKIARAENLWLHVDAAWGGFGLLGRKSLRFRTGLDHADSITWDAHKHGGAPVASSFLLVRDRARLASLRPPTGGGYLFHRDDAPWDEQDLGLTSIYCGKPFLTLATWMTWKSLGRAGLAARVANADRLTRRFRDAIAASERYELMLEPQTWTVCFCPRADDGATAEERSALTARTRARVNESGKFMMNICPFKEEHVLRAVFVNPLMTDAHVDELVAHLEASHPGK
jgi:glutamate/tyrosine decarboxylase-like PLP-dependent enzyme